MKQLRPLIIIALLANLLTFALFMYAASAPVGSGLPLLFGLVWMPVLWLATFIVALVFVVIGRKQVFQKPVLKWTIPVLLFVTPMPAILIYYIAHPTPEQQKVSTTVRTIDGKVFVTESWEWTATHANAIQKCFVADSAQEAIHGDKAYKKDSTWVYFGKKGDTLKLEYYKNDSLVLVQQVKPQ